MSIKQKLYRGTLKLFYPNFRPIKNTGLGSYIKLGIKQKIWGYNRQISWPVHFTTVIKNYQKIQQGTLAPGSAPNCYLDGRNGIILEENVLIGPGVSIVSMNHNLNNYEKYTNSQPIIIRKNSWLATNCIVLAGVELGQHTIVAAGAVVTKSFPEGNQLLAGNPARVIRQLNNYEG